MANAGPNTNGSQFFVYKINISHIRKKELVHGGWPEKKLLKSRQKEELSLRSTPYRIWTIDEWSFAVLDEMWLWDRDDG